VEKMYVLANAIVLISLGMALFCKRKWVITSIIDQNRAKYSPHTNKLRFFVYFLAIAFLLGGVKLIIFDLRNPQTFIENNLNQKFY
jgi:hypothetical protein